MRLNKSKLWDKKRHKWIKNYSISPDGTVLDGKLDYDTVHETETELVWFAGRNDKNSVEIYEGDIIFSEKCFGCISTYGTHKDNFPNTRIVLWDENYNKYTLSHLEKAICDIGASGFYLCKANEGEFEVVGNVRENPDLLESNI